MTVSAEAVRSPSRPAALLGTVALGVRLAEHWVSKITLKEKGKWERKSAGFPVTYLLPNSKGDIPAACWNIPYLMSFVYISSYVFLSYQGSFNSSKLVVS